MSNGLNMNKILNGLPKIDSLSDNPVLDKLKKLKNDFKMLDKNQQENGNTGLMADLKNSEAKFTQIKQEYVKAYKELILLLKENVKKRRDVWKCERQDNGQYYVYCNGEFAKTDGFAGVYNNENDCEYTINNPNGYVKKNGLQCVNPPEKWTDIVDMNYASTLLKQGESTDDWTYFNKYDSIDDCKENIGKNIEETGKSFTGIVYFDSDYPTDAFKRDCYGKLGGKAFKPLPEKHVTSSFIKRGTTMFGGKKVEKKLVVLRGLNKMMESLIQSMSSTIDKMKPIADLNTRKLEKEQTALYDNIDALEKQRREINKMLDDKTDSSGVYAQEKLNLTMEQTQLFAVSILAIGGLAVTYRLMTRV